MARSLNFRTARFGTLNYQREDVIRLPEGLVGLPRLQNWLLLQMGDGIPMQWFQSLDTGDFAFPVSQADLFHDSYEIPLRGSAGDRLGPQSSRNSAILIITTIHKGGAKVTGNLLAPLLIDTKTRRGAQLTLDGTEYDICQEINYFKFGLAVTAKSAEDTETVQDTADAMVANGEKSLEPAGV